MRYLNIPHTTGSIALSSQRGCRGKFWSKAREGPQPGNPMTVDRGPWGVERGPQQSSPRSTTPIATPLVAGVGCQSTHRDPCTSSQQTMWRELQPNEG